MAVRLETRGLAGHNRQLAEACIEALHILGHPLVVRQECFGVEVDDAIEIAEKFEI